MNWDDEINSFLAQAVHSIGCMFMVLASVSIFVIILWWAWRIAGEIRILR